MKKKYILELYIREGAYSSQLAKSNLETVLKHVPKEHYQLNVTDVNRHPEICEKEKLVVLPVLVKVKPAPKQKFFGTLENNKVLAAMLGVINMLGVTDKVPAQVATSMLQKQRVSIPLIFEEGIESKVSNDIIIMRNKT